MNVPGLSRFSEAVMCRARLPASFSPYSTPSAFTSSKRDVRYSMIWTNPAMRAPPQEFDGLSQLPEPRPVHVSPTIHARRNERRLPHAGSVHRAKLALQLV